MDSDRMTPERWDRTSSYIRTLFAREDEHQRGLMERAAAAGLPRIDAGPETGRLLQMLVALTGGRLAIEVGTLAGASTIWMARGLRAGGQVITVELSEKLAMRMAKSWERRRSSSGSTLIPWFSICASTAGRGRSRVS